MTKMDWPRSDRRQDTLQTLWVIEGVGYSGRRSATECHVDRPLRRGGEMSEGHQHGAGGRGAPNAEPGAGGEDGAAALLAAAARLAQQKDIDKLAAVALANLTLQELWQLVGHGSTRDGPLSADHGLGNAHKLMRLMINEFDDRALMYDVFALAVAYQLKELDVAHVGDPRFTLTANEVLGWQEPVGHPVVGVTAEELQAALSAIAAAGVEVLDAKVKLTLKDEQLVGSKVLKSPPKRLAVGLQRLVTACARSRAPAAEGVNPVGQENFTDALRELSKNLSEGLKAAVPQAKEEDDDDLKAGTIDKMVEEHEKQMGMKGERPLKKQDQILKKTLVRTLPCYGIARLCVTKVMMCLWQVKILKRVRDEGRFPDVTHGDETIRPTLMVPLHLTSFADHPGEDEGRSLQVEGNKVRAKYATASLKFTESAQLGLAVNRLIMNIWYAASVLYDVPNKSAGEKKIGHQPGAHGTVKYAPRETAEALCVCILQSAGLYGNDRLGAYDVLMTKILSTMASQVNARHGALTIGAAMDRAIGSIEDIVVMGQMAGNLPISQPLTVGGSAVSGTPLTGSALAGGVAGPMLGAGRIQPYGQPPPYQLPVQTYVQQGYTQSPLTGFFTKSKNQLKRERRKAAGNTVPGILAGAAAYGQNQQLYAQQGGAGPGLQQQASVSFQPQAPQGPMQMPLMSPQGQVSAQPGKAANGRWVQMPGGNPHNPQMCNRKNPQPCVKASVCHMNHAQKP